MILIYKTVDFIHLDFTVVLVVVVKYIFFCIYNSTLKFKILDNLLLVNFY